MSEFEKLAFEKVEPEIVEQKLEPAPEAVAQTKTLVAASSGGVLKGTDLDAEYRLAKAYSRSGLMPAGLNTPEKVLVALQLCRELNLPPIASLNRICVINGSPSLFGDLPLSLVMRSGKLIQIKEWIFDKDGTEISIGNKNLGAEVFGAACTVHRKETGETTRTFTRADATLAGLWGKKVWAVYPKRMLQMRCRSHALKDVFPDILTSVQIAEYDQGDLTEINGKLVGQVEQKTFSGNIADELNAEFIENKSVSETSENK